MPVDVIIKVFKDVVVKALILMHVDQIVLHTADKVSEQHLVMDEHTIVEEVVDELLQLLPVVEVVNLLLEVTLEQLVEFVCSDWLCGFVEEAHGLLVGTVKNASAFVHVHVGSLGVLASLFLKLPP